MAPSYSAPAPGKLIGLAATAGNAEATLSWAARPAGESVINYDYRQSDPKNPWTDDSWLNFTTTTNSLTVTGLTNGTTYSFQVRANNPQGEGPDSDTVTATPAGPPAAVELRADRQSAAGTEVRLYWSNPGDSSITKYQLSLRKGNGGAFSRWADITTTTSGDIIEYTVTCEVSPFDATAGGTPDCADPLTSVTYAFRVRAINDEGDGAFASVTATPTTSETAPAQMSNVRHTVTGVTGGNGGTVTFNWEDPGDDSIDKYQYRYDGSESNPGDGNWDVDWADIPGGTANDKDLTTWTVGIHGSSTTVFYELRAINNTPDPDLPGPATAIELFRANTPTGTTSPPDAPTVLTAAGATGEVALSWTAPSGTLIGFQYRQSMDGGSNWMPDWTTIPTSAPGETNAASFTKTGLTNGVVYTFEVRAVAGTVDSPVYGAAARVSGTAGAAPNAPTSLTVAEADVEAERQTSLKLTWVAGATITGVDVDAYQYRQQATGDSAWSGWQLASGGSTLTINASGLAAGTLYEFQVRAVDQTPDGDVASDPSNTASGTTAAPSGPPGQPMGLSAIGGVDEVTLSWSDAGDGNIIGYFYTQSPGAQTEYLIDVDQSKAARLTSYTVTGLEHGTEYTFTLIAENAAGRSVPSAPVTLTVNAAPMVAGGAPSALKIVLTDGPYTVDLSEFIVDPDDDPLDYTATSSDEAVGTVSISDSLATFTPLAVGTTDVTVTAADAYGAKVSHTIKVTVTSSNAAPEVVKRIDPQTLSLGGAAKTLDVSGNFHDPDGDALTFSAVSSNADVVTVSVAGSAVTIAPQDLLATAEITVTAADPAGATVDLSFVVKVVEVTLEDRITRVNKVVLPEVARAMTASTLDAVTGRIGRVASGSMPTNTLSLGGASSLYHALKSNGQALENGRLDLQRLLGGSSFALSLNPAEGGKAGRAGDIGVWGSGDYRSLSGGDTSAVEWDGNVVSAHLGADARLRRGLLAGLSVSISKGSFDYTDRTTGTAAGGAFESWLTSVNPYVSLTAGQGLGLWATVGYGWGELEINDDAAGRESSDLTQWSAALGASATLLTSDGLIKGGTTGLKLKGEGSLARVDVEGNSAAINELTVDVNRLRVSLEGSHAHKLASGGTLTPAIELGLRHDGGDGETGRGIELGGSLRYHDPASGLTVEGHGRTLLAHGGNYEEWGIGGLVRLDPGTEGRGMSLSLAPAWGETQSGFQRLWNDGATDPAANDNEARGRLQAELGYGFGVFGGQGLLTPYSGLSLGGEGARRYSVGSRLEIGPSVNLSFEGERREAANDAAADHGVMLHVQLRF